MKGENLAVNYQSVQFGYILDAYIPALRLAFEADGPFHNKAYDDKRDGHLLKYSIRTVRFTQRELQGSPQNVIRIIKTQIRARQAAFSCSAM